MTNEQLLEHGWQTGLLTAIEAQERFILKQASKPTSCPNCATPVNQFAAAGVSINDFKVDGPGDYKYRCPNCGRHLIFVVPFFGGWIWQLVPEAAA